MKRTMLVALWSAALIGVALAPSGRAAAGPSLVAFNRCDSRNINDVFEQLRGWEKTPPKGASAQVQRLNDLRDAINSLNQERGVLDAVCPATVSRAPFNAQIGAGVAWALLQQTDIFLAVGPPCPAAGNAIPNQLVASAWLSLAAPVNEAGGAPPQSIQEIVPKVQAHAAALNLTLPPFHDTSSYWRDQIAAQSKAAVAACPTQPPVKPTPTPTPVPAPFYT